MASSDEILKLLKLYLKDTGEPSIPFKKFVNFVDIYHIDHGEEDENLAFLSGNIEDILTAQLLQLEKEKHILVNYVNQYPAKILLPSYYIHHLRRAYAAIAEKTIKPFPTEESLQMPIPPEIIEAVDIKIDFIKLLHRHLKKTDKDPHIIRLLFPEGIQSMLISSDLLPKKLLEFVVHKIRLYMRTQKNASYIKQKITPIFRQRELALRDLLNNLLTRPDQIIKEMLKPSDFLFHVLTHISSQIIKDYAQKNELMPEESSYCQAAYMLGFYNVFYKSLLQKEKEEQIALRTLDFSLKKPPYSFTITDIHQLRDKKGVLLTKQYPVEKVNKFIQEKTSIKEDASLPELIRVRAKTKKEYYIRREYVTTVCIDKIFKNSDVFKQEILDSWIETLKNDKKLNEMTDDSVFEKFLQKKTGEDAPLLDALLRYELLFLCLPLADLSENGKAEINRLFDEKEKKLIPLSHILRLSRKDIFAEAKLHLPFWQAIPVLNVIAKILKNMFKGSAKKKKPAKKKTARSKSGYAVYNGNGESKTGGQQSSKPTAKGAAASSSSPSPKSSKAQLIAYRKAVEKLTEEFIGPNGVIDDKLDELQEKWNPLLDPKAKSDLVEDINSLVRDFMRKLKKGFAVKPPDAARIRNLAVQLSSNSVFNKIKRKEYLMRYLEIYMLKILKMMK
jgi:hypothetical protein